MLRELIPIITQWQLSITQVEGITRTYNKALYEAAHSKPIKIITGFRRSGKSFLVKMVARALIEDKKYSLNNVLYLNFEDYQLAHINQPKELDDVIQMFLHELAGPGRKLIIFDEIQNVAHWDKFIRTLYEKENGIELFLTGSNSELLSSEIGSNLAGRFISFEILPFSFQEILNYRNLDISNEIEFYKQLNQLKYLFSQYQQFGGLPEILTINNEATKYSYLQGILSKVILDDIIKRFNVRQPELLEKILHFLYISTGNIINPARITNFIKSEGIHTKADTISTYIDHIVKTFALYPVERFDWKLKRVFSVSKKYYSVDTGLINLFQKINNNYSKQLEAMVFLKLKRLFNTVYYGSLDNGKEIDFIIKDNQDVFYKYQVTQILTNQNWQRELSAFSFCDGYLDKGNNIILTLDEKEEALEFGSTIIQKKYLIKWLLDC